MTKRGETMELRDRVFLDALRCALAGQTLAQAGDLTAEQWQKLAQRARLHKVLPLIYQSLSPIPQAREALASLRSAVRSQVVIQTQKTHAFLTLKGRLEAAGIPAMVVKGAICRNLYPQPDLRPSSDEDLLVPPEQYEVAQKVLEDFGMTCVSVSSGDYERGYRMATGPLYVELHRDLFCPEEVYGSWNGYFREAFSRSETVLVQGEPVLTMAPTDHMLYLILHAFKHFLHGGVGIRQVCDMGLYARANGERIDWDRVRAVCRELRAEGFAGALFQICEKYLGLPGGYMESEVDAEPLLEDILNSGIYGSATPGRQRSGNVTLGAVKSRGRGPAVLSALFPEARKLEGQYPYLKGRRWLLPVAWAQRILRYGLRHPKDAGEAAAIGKERVELLRKYGVI